MAEDHSTLVLITLLSILLAAVEYASIRQKYDWVYSWYAGAKDPNIGANRAVLAYERPWLANTICNRPITQSAAEFLFRIIRTGVSVEFLTGPIGDTDPAKAIQDLNALVQSEAAWKTQSNPLFVTGNIGYNSTIVQGYLVQIGRSPDPSIKNAPTTGDLSLQLLWVHGYEEYIRERFTWAATSVLSEWNFLYGILLDMPAIPTTPACDPMNMTGSFLQSGIGAAGVGAMVGGPWGALIGFSAGLIGSLFQQSSCI